MVNVTGDVFAQTGNPTVSAMQIAEIQKKYGLNPSTPLTMRIGETLAPVLQTFRDAGISPRKHILTEEERIKVSNAFAGLTPLHKRVLLTHLRSISFLDDMPNTALTSTINQVIRFHSLTSHFGQPSLSKTYRNGSQRKNEPVSTALVPL